VVRSGLVTRRHAAVAGVAGILVLGLLPASAIAEPTSSGGSVPVPARYTSQKLAWTPCAPDEEDPVIKRMECATMTVPKDWNHPNGGKDLKIAVSRLRPATGTATESVIGNPGGPGGSGLGMPVLLNERPALRTMELVGFDPRGTGISTNVSCGGAPNTFSIDPRDRDRRTLNLVAKASALYGEFCKVTSPDLVGFITTEQTVKDIDLIRTLLGRKKINFLGYSGGTWMGAWYGTFFPKNTGRFVLDSNTQFTGPWEETFALQPLGFERRFRQDFAAWAAKYDSQFHLGTSAEGVRRFYEALRADLKKSPLLMDLGGLIAEFTPQQLDSAIVGSLYSKQAFPDMGGGLLGVRQAWDAQESGGAAAAQKVVSKSASSRRFLAMAAKKQSALRPLAEDAMPATFNSILCNDTKWHRGQAFFDRLSGELGRKYPLLGWSLNQNPCAYWDRPNITVPAVNGKGVPQMLMVQSVHDPATPFEGATKAHKKFAGSRMITVQNEGDHSIYITGNACVDAIADKFLTTGVLPAADVTCQGTGIPAPPTDPASSAKSRTAPAASGSPLERAARYAQILTRH
jgi:pimeloyl-ACP methyl ester carboxylesterase